MFSVFSLPDLPAAVWLFTRLLKKFSFCMTSKAIWQLYLIYGFPICFQFGWKGKNCRMVGILHRELQTFFVSFLLTGIERMKYLKVCSAAVPFTASLQICGWFHSHFSTILGRGRVEEVCQAPALEKVECHLPVREDLLKSK